MSNTDENLRTPDELAMLEILEPEMKEIIVEGRGDQALLYWFLSCSKPEAEVAVFPVKERVLLDDDVVFAHGHTKGGRGSVITVAEIIEKMHPTGNRVRFVADRDLGALGIDKCPKLQNIFYTDYASMELYFYSEKTIGKMLKVALRGPSSLSPKLVLEAITPVLVSIFIIRSILRSMERPPKLASKVIENLQFTNDGHTLNVREAFSKSCKGVNVDSLVAKYDGVVIPDGLDMRHLIRGHDISGVLVRYITSIHGNLFREDRRHLAKASAMEICLISCLELTDIEGFGLFKSLAEFATTSH
ncbi:hypothetical protein ACN6LK_004590 [Streptomyces griseus]|uniref:hypothetical protein n=1 Tax=Streptomyces griseus TaxID=1911 RepID=UPI00403D2221